MKVVFYKKQKSSKAEKQKGRRAKKSYGLMFLRSYGLTVLLSYFLTVFVSYGQTCTWEKPVSLTKEIPALRITEQSHKVFPPLDMQKIEQEDAEDNEKGIIPRFGYKYEVNYTLENSGDWIELPNGDKMWRLQIYCPNATSINLLYDHFWLPEGAKFFIYSNDFREQLGAFTSKNNKGSKEAPSGFSTGLIRSDNITLEYYVPKETDDMGIISISRVVHGYRGLGFKDREGGVCFDCSNKNHKNVICEAAFKDEKDAVVIVVGDGYRNFTGSLVNTTANETNDKHYILTYWETKYGVPNITSWGVYWHYESYECTLNNQSEQPPLIYTQGATLVASSQKGHFALLKLEEDPGLEWDIVPYYLGWDRTGNVPTGKNWIIHHTDGDIKKIANSDEHDIVETYWMDAAAWIIHSCFYDGDYPQVPQMGSYGAPLLNSNHKLIGQLWKTNPAGSCGPNGCKEYNGIFGKFSYAWDKDTTSNSSSKLKDWLDPLNTGATTLNGRRSCQETIGLHRSYPLYAYHAVQNIISKQVIPNKVSTTYKAGSEIQLIEGFHAKAGSTFHAKIEENTACSSKSNSISYSSQSEVQKPDNVMGNSNTLNRTPNFSLSPNPNTGAFKIETNFPVTEVAHLKITNTLGVPVYETQTLVSNEIQLPNASAGLYFVVVVLNDGTLLNQKMMIQR